MSLVQIFKGVTKRSNSLSLSLSLSLYIYIYIYIYIYKGHDPYKDVSFLFLFFNLELYVLTCEDLQMRSYCEISILF
jgi:hypothetical protein